MKHVFGNRNNLNIYLRQKNHSLYKKFKKLYVDKKRIQSKIICCYPSFKSQSEKINILNRFAWAFPENSGVKILHSTDYNASDTTMEESEKMLENQEFFLKSSHNIQEVSNESLVSSFEDSQSIAIHKKSNKYDLKLWDHRFKCEIIDPTYYSIEEGNFWKFGLYNTLDREEKEFYSELSTKNFNRFRELNSNKKRANIFVTGPSFGSYKEFKFLPEESINIVCNTIVKDTEFLDFIGGADIITFADPVFHFSSNNYSCEFRRLVINAVKRYNSFVVVPHATIPLLIYNHPELKDNIIGLKRADKITFPSKNELSVMPASSIITFIMLPLGISLADEIYVLGADGRGKNEKYFWKHNDKVQLTDLMESVFKTHPSFFRDRDYADYYEEHCKFIERMIVKGENELNKKIYSLSESFIPAFQNRLFKR